MSEVAKARGLRPPKRVDAQGGAHLALKRYEHADQSPPRIGILRRKTVIGVGRAAGLSGGPGLSRLEYSPTEKGGCLFGAADQGRRFQTGDYMGPVQEARVSGASTFAQHAESARSERIGRAFYWVMAGPGILLLAVAVYSWWVYPEWWSPAGPGTITGIAILGIGLVVIPTMARMATNRLVELSIDDVGIRLKFQRGPFRIYEWSDPKFHVIISPPVRSASGDARRNSESWYLSLRSSSSALSTWVTAESGASIVERAGKVGIRITRSPIGTVTLDGSPR